MEIIHSKKDEECKKMKEEIVFLKEEVDLLNKNLMSSQTLDDILSHQRPPVDKLGLGYVFSLENVIHFHYNFTIMSIISPPFHYYVTTFIPLSLSLGKNYVFLIFINSKPFK